LKYLIQCNIGTRLLFGGNLTKQPYFKDQKYRISGNLNNTDIIMEQTFWIGIYPKLNKTHFDYIADKLESFFGLNF